MGSRWFAVGRVPRGPVRVKPTTGLDAKAAAIVMQAMKNVAETGRTIVCTIHQPSIDIFEAFDEDISGVPKIKKK
ncbi:hypothetical protein CsSME_00010292 [Camellia sinensis var. sinensis]